MTAEGPLLVGWASASITPDVPVQLTGQHYVRISEYVRDPVTATALALESLDSGGASLDQAVIVSCDLAHAMVGFNRCAAHSNGTSRMYGSVDTTTYLSPEGVNDHGIELLFFWNREGDPIGVVVNLACPSQVVETKCLVSAGIWDASTAYSDQDPLQLERAPSL